MTRVVRNVVRIINRSDDKPLQEIIKSSRLNEYIEEGYNPGYFVWGGGINVTYTPIMITAHLDPMEPMDGPSGILNYLDFKYEPKPYLDLRIYKPKPNPKP